LPGAKPLSKKGGRRGHSPYKRAPTPKKQRKERTGRRVVERLQAHHIYREWHMAKDTEKLIRQLSLISYLMAERRPVTALEIRRDVEGYSGMNEDAFARRFYADRAELESLGIQLTVDKPIDGVAEQENYSLRPENFHLPAIAFTDEELASLQFALNLLDGEFAYAEPLRLALQQISWGRPSPLRSPDQGSLALGITGSAGGHDLSHRLAKVETAIFRQKTITFDYYTMERDELGARKVDPYHLLFRSGQFYLLGRSHERGALRVFRLSRIRGKVAYATKAEHDFKRPQDFDPRLYANRADWQYGDTIGTAEVWVSERIAWQIERHYGRFGEIAPAQDGVVFSTSYSSARQLAAWVLSLGEHVRVEGPPELVDTVADRVALLAERHEHEPQLAAPVAARAESAGDEGADANGRREAAIRPERFARLVTLASILIEAGRAGERLREEDVCERLQITPAELREDVNVLNVVNFGGGSYVLYAEVGDDGWIEVDPEPYSDNFARPARLLPVEAKALVAAIDLIGEHLPEGALTSAREKIVAALGADPMEQGLQIASAGADDSEVARVVSQAIAARRLLRLEYYKANEDEFSERTVEPYALINGREGWYVASFDPAKDDVRHFRLDRIKRAEVLKRAFRPRPEVDPAADVEGWPRTGEVEASRRARVWISPERARWAREERTVVQELADGSVVVELSFAGEDWLVREVLKEAGDAAVLEPPGARAAVRRAIGRLQVAARA
jgi:proteasome accessory factor BC